MVIIKILRYSCNCIAFLQRKYIEMRELHYYSRVYTVSIAFSVAKCTSNFRNLFEAQF